MLDLFGSEQRFPAGFTYTPEFITPVEEATLCDFISTLQFKSFLFHGYEAKRQVVNFGYDYHFNSRSITKGEPIPQQLQFLIERLAQHTALPASDFQKVLVTQYPPGSVINWHRDAPPFELIAGVSLASDCVFRLRPYRKEEQSRKTLLSFPVQQRSLYVMQGESREQWEHSTRPVEKLRFSITVRTLRNRTE